MSEPEMVCGKCGSDRINVDVRSPHALPRLPMTLGDPKCECETGDRTPLNCWSCSRDRHVGVSPFPSEAFKRLAEAGKDEGTPGKALNLPPLDDTHAPGVVLPRSLELPLTIPVWDIVIGALRQLRDLDDLDRDEAYLLALMERSDREVG